MPNPANELTALCPADTNYILSKQQPETEVRKILRKFKVLVNVLPKPP